MGKKYKAIIVDDEALLVNGLLAVLKEFCPEVEVVGTASSAFEANLKIQSTQPDIVFLDINLPKVNGLEMLEAIEHKTFQVIIITAYDSYALQALKAGAVDYILKPVMSSEVRTAVDKAIALIEDNDIDSLTPERKEQAPASEPEVMNRIVIHHNNSYILIEFDDILYLEADRNYSNIVLENGKRIAVSQPKQPGFKKFLTMYKK